MVGFSAAVGNGDVPNDTRRATRIPSAARNQLDADAQIAGTGGDASGAGEVDWCDDETDNAESKKASSTDNNADNRANTALLVTRATSPCERCRPHGLIARV